jgi:hypothetical protein
MIEFFLSNFPIIVVVYFFHDVSYLAFGHFLLMFLLVYAIEHRLHVLIGHHIVVVVVELVEEVVAHLFQ